MSGHVTFCSSDEAGVWGMPITLPGRLPCLAAGPAGEVALARVDGDAIAIEMLLDGAFPVRSRVAVPATALSLELCWGQSGPVLIWTDSSACVRACARGASGWTEIVPLSMPEARATLCALASGGGITAAAWGADGAIEVAILEDGVWTPEGALGRGAMPQVAVDPSGEVIVAWVGEGSATVAAVRGRSGAWAAPHQLTDAWHGASGLRLGVAPDGTATLAWTAGDATVRMAQRARAGEWQAPGSLSPPGEPAYFPRVAAGPQGALCVWLRVDATVRAAFVPAGGDPTPAATLSAAPGVHPSTAIGGDGRAVVAWLGEDRVVVALRGDGLRWDEPQPLALWEDVDRAPCVAVDSRGGAVTGWAL